MGEFIIVTPRENMLYFTSGVEYKGLRSHKDGRTRVLGNIGFINFRDDQLNRRFNVKQQTLGEVL